MPCNPTSVKAKDILYKCGPNNRWKKVTHLELAQMYKKCVVKKTIRKARIRALKIRMRAMKSDITKLMVLLKKMNTDLTSQIKKNAGSKLAIFALRVQLKAKAKAAKTVTPTKKTKKTRVKKPDVPQMTAKQLMDEQDKLLERQKNRWNDVVTRMTRVAEIEHGLEKGIMDAMDDPIHGPAPKKRPVTVTGRPVNVLIPRKKIKKT
jgi:hypothetical protein